MWSKEMVAREWNSIWKWGRIYSKQEWEGFEDDSSDNEKEFELGCLERERNRDFWKQWGIDDGNPRVYRL